MKMADLVAAAAAAAAAASARSMKAAADLQRPPAPQAPPPPPEPSPPASAPILVDLSPEMIAELEKRADEMATKSLAALPAKIQATKLPVVRVAILKRLTEQAQAGQLQLQKPAASQAAPPAEPPPAAASPPVPSQGMDEDDEETERRVGLRRPATELPPPQDGVEACGDDPWFADPQIRLALKDAVEVAHSQETTTALPPTLQTSFSVRLKKKDESQKQKRERVVCIYNLLGRPFAMTKKKNSLVRCRHFPLIFHTDIDHLPRKLCVYMCCFDEGGVLMRSGSSTTGKS